MPVSPVGPQPVATPTDAPSAPDGGFDDVLASMLPPPRDLPSVPLGHMVSAIVGGPPPPEQAVDPLSQVLGAGFDGSRAAARGVDGAGTTSATPSGPGAAILEAGERYLGVPYKWGGTDASTGFDCSGFVQQVFADLGVQLPRVSVDQARAGDAVGSLAEAQPGDLVFWNASGGRPNHIGIYAGDGEMLVAPRTGDVVRYQEITRTPDQVRRVIA